MTARSKQAENTGVSIRKGRLDALKPRKKHRLMRRSKEFLEKSARRKRCRRGASRLRKEVH